MKATLKTLSIVMAVFMVLGFFGVLIDNGQNKVGGIILCIAVFVQSILTVIYLENENGGN